MMQIKFLEPAETEFLEAIAYYNVKRPGLGNEFAQEVEDTINRIVNHPEAWSTVAFSARTRRCLTQRFPYAIVYQIREDCLLIVAVMHLRRRPQTWQERISKKHK
jgi:plasmid stabilization system protein ParE